MTEFYTTIAQAGQAEYKDRGSKFLAFAFPVSSAADFKKELLELKKEHPKAAHHCFAYRLGLDRNNFRVSDDGEPSGTAGKPILGQIDSKNITDVSIIVVRYFGGSLLGVPGLINAYKTVSSLVLQVIPLVPKAVTKKYSIHFDYTQMNDLMLILKQLNVEILRQETQLFCLVELAVPLNRKEEFLYRLSNLRNVEVAELV